MRADRWPAWLRRQPRGASPAQLRPPRRRCYSQPNRNAVFFVEAHGPHCHHRADAARGGAGARRAGAPHIGRAAAGVCRAAGAISAAVGSCRGTAAVRRAGGADHRGPAGRPHASAVGRGPARLRVPDDRILGAGAQPAARILRAGDLAGEPVPARRGRPAHAQRRARPGHRPVHAAHRGRARPARSVRSGAGAAEIGRVPARARRPVRQSRARGGGLQCRAAAGARLAVRRAHAAGGDAQLRARDHRALGRRMGAQRQARAGAAAAAELHAADGAAAPRAQSVCREARGAGEPGGRQPVGRAARGRLLARPCARELRHAGAALCRGADRPRPEPAQQRVPQPRHPAVLPGAGRGRNAARRRTACAAASAVPAAPASCCATARADGGRTAAREPRQRQSDQSATTETKTARSAPIPRCCWRWPRPRSPTGPLAAASLAFALSGASLVSLQLLPRPRYT